MAKFWRRRHANDRFRGGFLGREKDKNRGGIFGVKERNEPRNFEDVRRVKEQKKSRNQQRNRGEERKNHRLQSA